jgi:Ca2+/Na+ antiporter
MGNVQVQAASKKPAVPEFTVKLIDNSYDEPPTSYVDAYTGETVTKPGYRVAKKTIEITIKNQPGDYTINYNVRVKGHYGSGEDAWIEIYQPSNGFPSQSDSKYTVLSFTSTWGDKSYQGMHGSIYAPDGSVIDFQVKAIMDMVTKREITLPVPGTGWYYEGVDGEWSSTKTLTIGTNSNEVPNQNEPTPSPTYTSDQNETQTDRMTIQLPLIWFLLVLILCPVIIVVLIVALIYTRKTARHKQTTQT